MSTTNVRHRRLAAGLAVALGALTVPLVETARSADTPPPTSVAVAGSLQSEVGCPGDWQPDCAATELIFDAADGVWQASFDLPAGSFEYKVALNDSWDENYGVGGALNGANIPLVLAAPATVKFFYDHGTHWVTDNVGSIVATVPGSFQSELGCPGDWQPDCLRSWLQDPDGDGTYGFSTAAIPAGDYEAKVALGEKWDINYGAGGVQNGPNILFSVEAGDTVTFTWDSVSKVLTVVAEAPAPGQPDSVTIAGNLQSELGCAGDWDPSCTATGLAFDADDTVWQGTFSVPAGNWEYKAALNGSWDENYGANATPNGANIQLPLPAQQDVKFFYDHGTHWITDNVTSQIATAAGSFQSELGCPGDWQPDCLRSWLQDPDGDGTYTFSTTALPAGSYEFKVAMNERWDESYGAGGGNDNVPFTVPAAGTSVTISFNGGTNIPTVVTGVTEPCEVGSYSATGSAPCTPAPPGYLVDSEGAIWPTPCPVGRYQDQAGQSSCIPAPIGYYVSAVAAVAATACPPGTTTLAEGATSDGFCVADAYRFTGFSAPVDNDGVLNQVKAGQTVPLKWRLTTTDGLPVTDLDVADVRVTVSGLSCSTGVSVDALEEYAAGSSGLQNLGDGYYQWNWKTPRTYAGSCKTMKLSLGEAGDATHDALFRFTK